MRFLLALVAAALAPLALAAPAPAEAAVSEKRVIGNIHMCTEENWKGTCHNNFFPLDKCTHLTDVRGGFFNLKVGSAGADPGANCRLFDEEYVPPTTVQPNSSDKFLSVTAYYMRRERAGDGPQPGSGGPVL
ncbi:hypothetical protein GE09DRAFT_1065764 [Coniochaeta sp. 2T2.1]|nr:hypothetical protein GE09DRAFT_1065764 [Coniochaeta sp. 2T2.1]